MDWAREGFSATIKTVLILNEVLTAPLTPVSAQAAVVIIVWRYFSCVSVLNLLNKCEQQPL